MSFFENTRKPAGLGGKIYDGAGAGKGRPPTPVEKTAGETVRSRNIEDHFKYRPAVMEAYPCGHYPIFEGYDHMQYQIRDPKGFAEMLSSIAAHDDMPKLPFIRKGENPI